MLYGSVNELLHLGKFNDFIELLDDLSTSHPEYGAIEKNIFTTAQLRMEAGADFEQASNMAMDFGMSFSRFGNPREDLQQGAFPGAVPANHAYDFAAFDLEGDVLQSPKRLFLFFPIFIRPE